MINRMKIFVVYLIENYKNNIRYRKSHLQKKNKQMNNELIHKPFSSRYQRLSFTIIDIRNNSDPITSESNTIIKSDNTYSNETKKLVKVLISKNWTYDEIAFEMERICRMGTITRFEYFESIDYKQFLILGLFMGLGLYCSYRMIKPVYKFIYKKFS
jgi:hypothetical protein